MVPEVGLVFLDFAVVVGASSAWCAETPILHVGTFNVRIELDVVWAQNLLRGGHLD